MDHNLENLGPERFQQLCQALLTKEYPGIVCFPVAPPDGGRDALRYTGDGQATRMIVFQVKFSRNPLSADERRDWVFNNIENELEKVQKLIARGATDYILITNVQGTAHLDVGSIDRMERIISTTLNIPTQCWWRDDINRRLDGSWDLKLRYPDVLSGQDFLRLFIPSINNSEQERRQRAIVAFMTDQYLEDVEVKFKQVELQNKLLDLFVDLPFSIATRRGETKAHELAASIPFGARISSRDPTGAFIIEDLSNDNGGTATLLLSELAGDPLNQVVVEGAPGQGKSTLAQYICQVHRLRWLGKADEIAQLPLHHANTVLRLPVKVDLRDLATWLIGTEATENSLSKKVTRDTRSLEAFLASLIHIRSGGITFDVNDLIEVSRLAPLLLVLDGLDEVADLRGRADVVAAVYKATTRLRENCPLLRLIITSRPAAFANSPGFDRQHFPHIELGAVRRAQVQLYARKWMDSRHLQEKERLEFEIILNEKLEQPHLRDLARNPMQLTILLSLVHTKGAALPDKRTSLYDAYIDLFFSREASKNSVVRRNVELLKEIHKYIAWVLHADAERNKMRANGQITDADLRDILREYLNNERHNTAVIDDIFSAVLERVVMIVSRVEGTYEFEVQPLREYFAARYLYDTASYSPPGGERSGTKPDRFDAIARNFYWLNVTRFFCGCFSKGEHLDLAERVKELCNDLLIGKINYPFILSSMLLSDWVFAQTPRAVHDIAAMLSSSGAIRHLLSSGVHYHNDRSIQIPMMGGGDNIIEGAFLLLESDKTQRDLGWRIGSFIESNANDDLIINRWIMSAGSEGQDQSAWLLRGIQLGILAKVNEASILKVLGDRLYSREEISNLVNAGRYDCVFRLEANVEIAISRLFDQPIWFDFQIKGNRPLYLLPMILSMANFNSDDHALIFSDPVVIPTKEFVERFSSMRIDGIVKASQIEEMALRLSSKFANLIVGSERVDFLIGMEEVVQDLVLRFGERPGIVALACGVSEMTRRTRGRLKSSNLGDRERFLCHRTRFARSRAKNFEWWVFQFGRISDQQNRFLTHFSFWKWAPMSVMFEMADLLSELTDRMSNDEWKILLKFLPSLFERSRSIGTRDSGSVLPVSQFHSKRLALLVGMRWASSYGRSVFLEYFLESGDGTRTCEDFRQKWAFESALSGALEWETSLKIIRTTYANGAWSEAISAPNLGRRRSRIPYQVALQVLAAPQEYPADLWDLAESAVSARIRRDIRPVGNVAEKDGWFESYPPC